MRVLPRVLLWTSIAVSACVPKSSPGDDAGDGTTGATAGSTTADPTEGGPLGHSCKRRDPGPGSPPGFHWSVGCSGPLEMLAPQAAVFGDGGFVLLFDVLYTEDAGGTASINLGGDDLVHQGGWDVVIARFDVEGQHVWSQLLGDEATQNRDALTAMPDGGVAFALDMGGAVTVGGQSVSVPGEYDSVFVVLDATGAYRWSRTITGANFPDNWASIYESTSAPDGSLLMVSVVNGTVELEGGGTHSSPDPDGRTLVAIYESDGTLRRAEVRERGMYGVVLAPDGSIVFGNADGLERIDPTGATLWALQGWSDNFQPAYVRRTVLAPNGDVVVAGVFGGTINLGGGDLVNDEYDFELGNLDVFVARFGPDGSHQWSLSRDGGVSDVGLVSGAGGDVHLFFADSVSSSQMETFAGGGTSLAARTFAAGGLSSGGSFPDGSVLVAGHSAGPADLGGGPLDFGGGFGVWFARLAVK